MPCALQCVRALCCGEGGVWRTGDKGRVAQNFPLMMKEFGGAGVVGAHSNNILMKDAGFMRGLSDMMNVPTYWAHKAYLRFMVAYGLGSDLSNKFLEQGLQVG